MPGVLLEAFVIVLIKCKLKFYCSDVFLVRKLGIEFSVTFCLADFFNKIPEDTQMRQLLTR